MIDLNSKILITGATGFVGSYVTRQLLVRGYKNIYALKRINSRTLLLDDVVPEINLIDGDVLDIVRMEEIIENMDVVIHTAAMVSFRKSDRNAMMKINIEGTANLVNICVEKQIKRFIHISSIAALGRSESGKIIDETSEWKTNDINSDYAISKYLSELEVWRGFSEGLKGALLNPSLIIGAGFWNNGTGEFFNTVKKGLKFYPAGSNGFVDVRDVALMAIKLMESDIIEERFICSASNVKHKDFFSKIAEHLGKKPPSIRLNNFLIRTLSFLLDCYNLITGGKSNLSSQSLKNASFDSIYENKKSIETMNFNYIPVDKTISDTCIAFKESLGKDKEFAVFFP